MLYESRIPETEKPILREEEQPYRTRTHPCAGDVGTLLRHLAKTVNVALTETTKLEESLAFSFINCPIELSTFIINHLPFNNWRKVSLAKGWRHLATTHRYALYKACRLLGFRVVPGLRVSEISGFLGGTERREKRRDEG